MRLNGKARKNWMNQSDTENHWFVCDHLQIRKMEQLYLIRAYMKFSAKNPKTFFILETTLRLFDLWTAKKKKIFLHINIWFKFLHDTGKLFKTIIFLQTQYKLSINISSYNYSHCKLQSASAVFTSESLIQKWRRWKVINSSITEKHRRDF